MPAPPAPSARAALLLASLAGLTGLAGLLVACGEEVPAAPAPETAASSLGAAELLARLHGRVLRGTALNDRAGRDDAAQLAALLWPAEGSVQGGPGPEQGSAPGPGPGPTVHQMLTVVAGAVARDLTGEGEPARVRLLADDPVSLAIHDAWLVAASGGPGGYRTWCATGGAALLARLEEARQRLFERPPR